MGRLIAGDLGARVYYTQLNGFDTHANQRFMQDRLLSRVASNLEAFQQDLEAMGKAEQVLTLVFSEFGRRVQENASKGTDHGTAAPMLLLGAGVKGGMYGTEPRLDELEGGDLRHHVDFRAVYATVLERWLGADPAAVLGAPYAPLGFLAPA
jgi:uncharacterized protein (DUF1501 family)